MADDADEYNFVSKGKLKIKTDSNIKKKKKKSKNKDADKEKARMVIEDELHETQNSERQLTKAEMSFKQQQEKMQKKRILEKASTTHKQRVEKFNEHLDSLTEHFDIPKVSWTK